MKRSGRTLKQRLYGLKHFTSRLKRARYYRGHNVHSPYIYSIVRQVFMRKELCSAEHDLHDTLIERNIPRRRAIQLQNLMAHCAYDKWSVDSMDRADLIVATMTTTYEHLKAYVEYARSMHCTLCIMDPYNNAKRWAVCQQIIAEHTSTTVDNRGYLLIFNNHLPKQQFRL